MSYLSLVKKDCFIDFLFLHSLVLFNLLSSILCGQRVELNFEGDMTFSYPYKMIRLLSSYTVRSLPTRSKDRPLSPDLSFSK